MFINYNLRWLVVLQNNLGQAGIVVRPHRAKEEAHISHCDAPRCCEIPGSVEPQFSKCDAKVVFVMDHHVFGHRDASCLERQVGFVFVYAGIDHFVLRHKHLSACCQYFVADQGSVENLQVVLEMYEVRHLGR